MWFLRVKAESFLLLPSHFVFSLSYTKNSLFSLRSEEVINVLNQYINGTYKNMGWKSFCSVTINRETPDFTKILIKQSKAKLLFLYLNNSIKILVGKSECMSLSHICVFFRKLGQKEPRLSQHKQISNILRRISQLF